MYCIAYYKKFAGILTETIEVLFLFQVGTGRAL